MKRRTVFIFIAVLAGIVVGIFAIMTLLNPALKNVYSNIMNEAAEVGEDFLLSLKNSDFQQAYSLFNTDLKQEIASANELESMFMLTIKFDHWEYELQTAESETGESAVGLIGEMTYQDGSKADFQVFVVPEEGDYKVAAFSFKPK